MRVSGSIFIRERQREDQWYAKWRVEGRQYKKRLGPVWTERGRPPTGYYTKRTAQEALQALLTDARRGALPDPVGGAHTYGEACEDFLRHAEIRGCSFSAVQGYRGTIRRHLLPEFGEDTKLRTISTERIDAYRERLLGEGRLSRRSIQKILVVNYGVLKRAVRRKWIPANPAEHAERVTLTRSGDFNVLSPEEVLAVGRAADDQQDAALFTVAAFTGLRMGELRALRWRDVDFANSSVLVRGNYTRNRLTTPKSGKVRSVPLIDQAKTALDGLSRRGRFTDSTDLVFVSDVGSYLDDADLRQRFYSALKRAGLGHKRTEEPPLRFHDLRHTFGTLGAQAWSLRDLQAYMGHASITTTEIYAHHVPKHQAAGALSRLVASGTGTQSVGYQPGDQTAENSAQLSTSDSPA
jgi:integrase